MPRRKKTAEAPIRTVRALPAPAKAKPLYAALGIGEKATSDEIRAAYMRIAKAQHPDLNGGHISDTFTAATHAYEVLSNPAARSIYDRTGADPEAGNLRKHALMMINTAAGPLILGGSEAFDFVECIYNAVKREAATAQAELAKIDRALERAAKARATIEKRWKGAPE